MCLREPNGWWGYDGTTSHQAKTSRVCSRQFKKEDFVNNPGKLRRSKKGAVPALFSWNNFQIPAPRASVWERRPRAESLPPVHDINSEEEMEVAILAPDHDYFLTPTTTMIADQFAEENDTLRQKVKELEQQIQALQQLQSCFGLKHFAGLDEDIRQSHKSCTWVNVKMGYTWQNVAPLKVHLTRVFSFKYTSNIKSKSTVLYD